MSQDRKKLEVEIEKQLHRFLTMVSEHAVDYTVLTVRKKNPDIDREHMSVILDTVRKGIDDGFMSNVDRFMSKIDEALLDFSSQENPTGPATRTKNS